MRTAQGIRQRTVAYPGELCAGEQTGWARLAANLDAKAAESVRQLPLFRPERDSEAEPVPEQVKVNLRGGEVSGVRDFGDVYLGLALWLALGLHNLLRELLPAGREEVRWDLLAAVLAVARFAERLETAKRRIEPSRIERRIGKLWKTLEHWARRAGLGNGVRIILDEPRRIKACDVILPASSGRRIRL